MFKILLLAILIAVGWGLSQLSEEGVRDRAENVVTAHKYIVEAKDFFSIGTKK